VKRAGGVGDGGVSPPRKEGFSPPWATLLRGHSAWPLPCGRRALGGALSAGRAGLDKWSSICIRSRIPLAKGVRRMHSPAIDCAGGHRGGYQQESLLWLQESRESDLCARFCLGRDWQLDNPGLSRFGAVPCSGDGVRMLLPTTLERIGDWAFFITAGRGSSFLQIALCSCRVLVHSGSQPCNVFLSLLPRSRCAKGASAPAPHCQRWDLGRVLLKEIGVRAFQG
jgi:hypothetical protein